MSANETNVVRYRIDASRSRFTVQATASGLFSAFGHNPTIAIRGFGGDARCVPGTLEAASLLLLAQADSLAVTDKVSDKDRREIERMMREDVLEIAHYPEIVFMSASVSANRMTQNEYRVRIDGNLSLHGVTRRCPIDAQVTVNGDSLRARGEFSLRQTDYGIKPVSVAGGTLKVKDELEFSFDINANAD
ncbi:MAG: YceI family protein [Pyrinomonadaceae bacterium]|nr:YceI family protein [Pyrinomonadaceae bacterium]MDQ3585540.1 YceI family protein [Acidobacteriota bacterium]